VKNNAFFILAGLVILLSSCKPFIYNAPDLTDYKIFPTRKIEASPTPFYFPKKEKLVSLPDELLWTMSNVQGKSYDYPNMNDFMKYSGTLTLLIARNDTIIYENYFNDAKKEDIYTVFSVTKSFSSVLTAIAIEEGFIKSIHQPVSDFIPEFKEKGREKMTIEHLLQMTSGIKESDYGDLLRLAYFYYAPDHSKKIKRVGLRYQPGEKFQYSSMTTQVLGMVLEKATGKKFDTYLKEKIWDPLGMEYHALASTDKKGNVKCFGGLSMNAIDMLKLGTLFLHKGNWQGKQLIPEDWIVRTQTRDTTNGRSNRYANCFWLDTYPLEDGFNKNDYFAGGYRGQIVYVNPENNTVMVRTGTREKDVHWGRSLSKLSHFSFQEENTMNNDKYFCELDGSVFKNKFGKSVQVRVENGRIAIRKMGENRYYEMTPSTLFTFENSENKQRLIIEMKEDRVGGIIVEEGNESYYYSVTKEE